MEEGINPATLVTGGAFVLAFIFGAVANRTNFCTMGAISDVVNMSHWGRVRMWLLAAVVAMAGTNLLHYFDLINLAETSYQRPLLPWLSMVFGGFLFGIGMTIAAGCANKNLVRLGAGSLRSLVVLVFLGLSSYMTLKGLFGAWRVKYLDPVSIDLSVFGLATQGLPELLAKFSGLPAKSALLITTAVLFIAALAFVLSDKRFRQNLAQMAGGVVLGLMIAAAWYLTGHLGHGENPETLETVYFATNSRTLESLSFVAPIAYSLQMLMMWTDTSLKLTFGIASVVGVVLGSFAYALGTGKFHWEGFASMEDLRTQLLGAMLMGFGGVTAYGCTIGQGLSGVSTLAIGSFIVVAGIIAGSVVTLKWQLR